MIYLFELPIRIIKYLRYRHGNAVPWRLVFSRIKIRGHGNRIIVSREIGIRSLLGTSIKINGSNNVMELGAIRVEGKLRISIGGECNRLVIGDDVRVGEQLRIEMIKRCRQTRVSLGAKTSFRDVTIRNFDHGSSVKIGRDCMFSYDVLISNTDEHAIFKDGILCNAAKELVIGDHVWVGIGATIFKNSHVASGSVVAAHSCVTRRFADENAVIAGVPACVMKTGVRWTRESPNQILEGQRYAQ